jgi:hypothetical protein
LTPDHDPFPGIPEEITNPRAELYVNDPLDAEPTTPLRLTYAVEPLTHAEMWFQAFRVTVPDGVIAAPAVPS